MKKTVILLLVVILCFIGCGSTGGSSNSTGAIISSFSGVMGKELKLVEVTIEDTFGKKIVYNRAELVKEKIAKTYTMTLTATDINGTAAPNTFTAPYKIGQGQEIEILEINSTDKAPIIQPEKLQEFAFFSYMQKASEWNIADGKLIFSSKTEEEVPVKLIFTL